MNAFFIGQPDGDVRLGDFVETNLNDHKWTTFYAAVAFVKQGGVKHLEAALKGFAQRADVKISVGINFGGTSIEGLSRLQEAVSDRGEIWVYHNGNGSTFHPKVYLFKNDAEAEVAIGSGNLTEGGLYTNYEAAFVLKLKTANDAERELLRQIEVTLDSWRNPASGLARLLDDELLDQLAERGYLPPEVYARDTEEAGAGVDGGAGDEAEEEAPLFATIRVKPAPARRAPTRSAAGSGAAAVASAAAGPTTFYMTLQRTDVGTGQVTPGAHARSPEIFIPLAARNAAPAFWDWPAGFTPDRAKPGKMDRFGVRMLIGTNIESVNMMTWPDKSDFRLRSEAMRSGGQIGDVLRIEKTDGSAGYLYIVTIIPQRSAQYSVARALCVNPVRNSAKEWGYV